MDWVAFVTFLGESDEWLIPLLFSIIFALFSIINSTNQSKQQVTQISIELMEKRLKYYNACSKLLDVMDDAGALSDSVIRVFDEHTFGIDFFFGDDVLLFYKGLVTKIKEISDLQYRKKLATSSTPDLEVIECEIRKLQLEMRQMKDTLKSIFDVYLDFSCYKATGEKK